MPGRFKLDENLPRDAKALLLTAGHDAETATDEHLGGNPDLKVLDACRTESRILITLDLDFADIRLYPPSTHPGVWVLRPATQSIENTLSVLKGCACSPRDRGDCTPSLDRRARSGSNPRVTVVSCPTSGSRRTRRAALSSFASVISARRSTASRWTPRRQDRDATNVK